MQDTDKFDCASCACVDVGTIISEEDSVFTVDLTGPDAEARYNALKDAALRIGSGDCVVSCETGDDNVLHACFEFSCAAESLIFQMKNA